MEHSDEYNDVKADQGHERPDPANCNHEPIITEEEDSDEPAKCAYCGVLLVGGGHGGVVDETDDGPEECDCGAPARWSITYEAQVSDIDDAPYGWVPCNDVQCLVHVMGSMRQLTDDGGVRNVVVKQIGELPTQWEQSKPSEMELVEVDLSQKHVHVLYGVADRDPNELVCMFFENKDDLEAFKDGLPGKYRTMLMTGIDYYDFEIALPVEEERGGE